MAHLLAIACAMIAYFGGASTVEGICVYVVVGIAIHSRIALLENFGQVKMANEMLTAVQNATKTNR